MIEICENSQIDETKDQTDFHYIFFINAKIDYNLY